MVPCVELGAGVACVGGAVVVCVCGGDDDAWEALPCSCGWRPVCDSWPTIWDEDSPDCCSIWRRVLESFPRCAAGAARCSEHGPCGARTGAVRGPYGRAVVGGRLLVFAAADGASGRCADWFWVGAGVRSVAALSPCVWRSCVECADSATLVCHWFHGLWCVNSAARRAMEGGR